MSEIILIIIVFAGWSFAMALLGWHQGIKDGIDYCLNEAYERSKINDQ